MTGADRDKVDVAALVPGHRLLPHERWFASRVYASAAAADRDRPATDAQGPAALVLTSAGRATAIPAAALMIILLVSTMVLGASSSHLPALYVGMRVGVPLMMVLLLLSIIRFEQGGRAARASQAGQVADGRPPPPRQL